jgi:hypothetical protein
MSATEKHFYKIWVTAHGSGLANQAAAEQRIETVIADALHAAGISWSLIHVEATEPEREHLEATHAPGAAALAEGGATSGVVQLAKRSDNAKHWTPRDALLSALDDLDSGDRPAFKDITGLLIIAVADLPDEYRINYVNAGMKHSQCILACELSKFKFMAGMGILIKSEDTL